MATKSKNRRAQTPKPRNEPMAKGMQELRQGNRAQPHRNKARWSKSDRYDKSYRNY